MATFADGESGLSVRTKINAVLQHADGSAGELVINDAGADVDFRVESDTFTHAVYMDAATGNVGIGTAAPSLKFVVSNSGAAGLEIGTTLRDGATLGTSMLSFTRSGGARIPLEIDGSDLRFDTGGSERMRIDASGNVGIGRSVPEEKLDINGQLQVRPTNNVTGNSEWFAIGSVQEASNFGVAIGLSVENQSTNSYGMTFGTKTNSASALTEKVRINAAGNLGLGVAPSAWGSATALEIANGPSIMAFSTNAYYGANYYYNGSAYIYKNNGRASNYVQDANGHAWFAAPSGTAAGTITWTQAMTLDTSGNLLVGTTTAAGSASNAVKMVGGVHSTVSGNIASLTTATPATMFTISGGVPSQVWMVSSDLDGEAAPSYQCVYMVTYTSSNSVTATQLVKGSLASITVSGLNVQYTQSSGGTKTNNRWSAVRIL